MVRNQDEFSENQVSYQRKGNNSYLAVKSDGKEMISYEINMIRYNKLQGLLPVQFWIEDGSYHYFYDISGKISLSERMKQKKYGLQEIRAIMGGLYNTIQLLEDHLLTLDALVLSPEYIYTEPQNLKPCFCFYPDKQIEFGCSLERLFEYLLNRLDYQDEKTVILVYSLYQKSREKNVPLSELMEQFYEIENRQMESSVNNSEYRPILKEEIEEKPLYADKNKSDTVKTSSPNEKIMKLIPYLPDAAGGFVIAFIVWRLSLIRSQLSAADFCLWGLCIAGIMYGCVLASSAISKILEADFDCSVEEKAAVPIKNVKKEKEYKSGLEQTEDSVYKKSVTYVSDQAVKKEHAEYEEMDFCEAEFEQTDKVEEKKAEKCPVPATVVMSPEELYGFLPAMLKSCGQKNFADIVLQEKDMLIGKMQGISQICIDSKAVSRMHARIMQGKDGWELIDLGSTNGTYVNGERLEEGFHCMLKQEDEIRFADVQYRFEML